MKSTGDRAYIAPAKSVEWSTPQAFFEFCEREFGEFDLDAAASPTNTKCDCYYTRGDDSLAQDWPGSVWCNPPYGRRLREWVAKAEGVVHLEATQVVMLLPARTGVRWFHDIFGRSGVTVYFVKGRLKFGDGDIPAGFDSIVLKFSMFDHAFRVGSIEKQGGEWKIAYEDA